MKTVPKRLATLFALLAICCALWHIPPVQAAHGEGEQYDFVSQMPVRTYYFRNPVDIEMDQDRNIYVLDRSEEEVRKYDDAGQILQRITYTDGGKVPFDDLNSITLDLSGNVYVANGEQIVVMDRNLELLTDIPVNPISTAGINIEDIAVNEEGELFILSIFSEARVYKISGGELDESWGVGGYVAGNFDYDSHVAVDNAGNVYVTEPADKEYVVYDPNGNLIQSVSTDDTVDFSPHGIDVDATGTVYVTDSDNGAVQLFDADGRHVNYIAGGPLPSDELNRPISIAAKNGWFAILDSGNMEIQVWHEDVLLSVWGSFGDSLGRFHRPGEMTFDAEGNLYVIDQENDRVQKFDATGYPLREWRAPGYNYQLHDIAVGQHGEETLIYVTAEIYEDGYHFQLLVFDAEGNPLRNWGEEGDMFDRPYFVDIGADGKVYLVDPNRQQIRIYSPDGELLNVWNAGDEEEFLALRGVAVDADGNVYVTLPSDRQIRKYDSTGALQDIWDEIMIPYFETAFSPYAIDVDASGNVFVTDYENDIVLKLNPHGEVLADLKGHEGEDGSFYSPEGIAVSSYGDVYVADSGRHRVQIFRHRGEVPAQPGLTGLVVNGGLLSPAFDMDTHTYTITVPQGASELEVIPFTMDERTQIYFEDREITGGEPIPLPTLPASGTDLTLRVVSERGPETYTLTVQREQPEEPEQPEMPEVRAELANLTVSPGTLQPAFAAEVTDYTVRVGHGVEEAAVSAYLLEPELPTATLTVAAAVYEHRPMLTVSGAVYGTYGSGETIIVPLVTGSNELALKVSVGEAHTTYTLDIRRASPPSRGGGGGGSSGSVTWTLDDVLVKETEGEQTRISIDHEKLQEYLRQEGKLELLPVLSEADTRSVELSLQEADVEALLANNPDLIVVLETRNGAYELPLGALDLAAIKQQLGQEEEKPLTLRLRIEQLPDGRQATVRANLAERGLTAVAGVVGFEVQALTGSEAITVESFGSVYVNRSIPLLNQEIDPDRTTGVRVDTETGDYRFVPTLFSREDGQWTALLKRPGNSFYTIVAHDKTFTDIAGHWAEENIGLLASKLIVFGMDDDRFAPDSTLTRAQYAALISRAMGLNAPLQTEPLPYQDVRQGAWYERDVAAALQAGIMQGDSDRQFGPDRVITREELAVVLAQASEFAGSWDGSADTAVIQNRFSDQEQIAGWALESVAYLAEAGIMEGILSGPELRFAPKQEVSRAEAAATLGRWLQAVEFVN